MTDNFSKYIKISEKKEDILRLLLRLLLAGIFIYSSWHKMADPVSFQIKVSEYEILPVEWEEMFSIVLPWVMFISSILLITGLITRMGAGVQAVMLAMFMVAIGVNIYRDRILGCGCFSEEGSPLGWGLLVQDFLLMLACAFLVIRGGGRFGLDRLGLRLLTRRNGLKNEAADSHAEVSDQD